jgi:hypothetical protein
MTTRPSSRAMAAAVAVVPMSMPSEYVRELS